MDAQVLDELARLPQLAARVVITIRLRSLQLLDQLGPRHVTVVGHDASLLRVVPDVYRLTPSGRLCTGEPGNGGDQLFRVDRFGKVEVKSGVHGPPPVFGAGMRR